MPERTVASLLAEPVSDAELTSLWMDHWCHRRHLASKGRKLLKRVGKISDTALFDSSATTLAFKNNAPATELPLYDDFRICDENGILFTVTPRNPWTGKSDVWSYLNQWSGPIVEGSWKDVEAWFKTTKS